MASGAVERRGSAAGDARPSIQPVDDTWFSRELPVLRTICRLDEQRPGATISDAAIAENTGLHIDTVRQSLRMLKLTYLELYCEGEGRIFVTQISDQARRASNQWP